MSQYTAQIERLAPEANPNHVESWMRLQYGTLDHLDPITFAREVALALDCIAESREDESESLARSYGLI